MDMYFHHRSRSGNFGEYNNSFIRMTIILLCCFFTNNMAFSDVVVYKNDCFGFITVNSKDKNLEIYKIADEIEGGETLLATCRIVDNKKDCFVISSVNLFSEIIKNVKVDITLKSENTSFCSNPVIIEASISKNENIKLDIFCDTCNEQKWMVEESENSGQIIYKSEVEIDSDCDYLHLFVTPRVNPFSSYSSFADSQTISFVDLSISELIDSDLNDVGILKIEIPDAIYGTCDRWVINEEYVVKMNGNIYWRGMLFEKYLPTPDEEEKH